MCWAATGMSSARNVPITIRTVAITTNTARPRPSPFLVSHATGGSAPTASTSEITTSNRMVATVRTANITQIVAITTTTTFAQYSSGGHRSSHLAGGLGCWGVDPVSGTRGPLDGRRVALVPTPSDQDRTLGRFRDRPPG